MRLSHVELFCEDTRTALEFYLNVLGFHHEADQDPFQWLKVGGQEILLRPGSNPKVDRLDQASHDLVLCVDDLLAAKAIFESRGLVFAAEEDMGCLTFQDPAGHWWQLISSEGH